MVLQIYAWRIWQQRVNRKRRVRYMGRELAEIYYNCGYKYFKKGDFMNALADFDKAIQLNPDYLKTSFIEGLILFTKEIIKKPSQNIVKQFN